MMFHGKTTFLFDYHLKFALKLSNHVLNHSMENVLICRSLEIKIGLGCGTKQGVFGIHLAPKLFRFWQAQDSQFSFFTESLRTCSKSSLIRVSTWLIRFDRCWFVCRMSSISSFSIGFVTIDSPSMD